MAFTEETIEFLIVNRLNDSKTWFQEHREAYLRLVRQPLEAVCEALAPVIAEIDPIADGKAVALHFPHLSGYALCKG